MSDAKLIDVHPNDAARRVLDVVRRTYEKNGGQRNFGFCGEESEFDSTGLTVEQRRLAIRVLADHGFVKGHGTRNHILDDYGVTVMLDPDAITAALPVPRSARPIPRPPTAEKRRDGATKFVLGETGMVRVLELLRRCDAHEGRQRFHVPLFKRVCQVLRERDGIDLEGLDYTSLDDICASPADTSPEHATVAVFLSAAWEHLGSTGGLPVSPQEFEERVNAIVTSERVGYRLVSGSWRPNGVTEAEALRRVLLRGEDDVASCRQGDLQVEMVVSTIQTLLARPGAVLVDYGAGLGRVLAGLAEASRFQTAEYVAVDQPIPDEVRALAATTGASSRFLSRSDFLAKPVAADAIMVVNTLHHVPFADIPSQMDTLLRALKPGGMLLVHEMGELREPEQLNVPWRSEDLHALFAGGAFALNARSTVSRSGVPLCHVLVALSDAATCREALGANVRRVWQQMKTRTIEEISQLYADRDEKRHLALQHALIINANLDLNRVS